MIYLPRYVEPLEVEFLAIVLTGLGLTVSILYYTSVLQNAIKTRELQIEGIELLKMTWTDYDDFENKYGSDNNPEN